MSRLILASDEIAAGRLSRRELVRGYRKLYRNVYAPKGMELTAEDRTVAAWMASGERAVMAGLSAAVLLGSKWVPPDAPAEMLGDHYRADGSIVVHSGRVDADDIVWRRGIQCTGVERTGFDLGRRLPFLQGLIRVDALLNATGWPVEEIAALADRNRGARNIRRLRRVLDLADGGAESPQETRVRLILMCGGLPRPQTQIRVGRRRIDMGWPEWKVGVEYDGEQHWGDPTTHGGDIARLEFLHDQGWVIVRVVAEHVRSNPQGIVDRAKRAMRAAGWTG